MTITLPDDLCDVLDREARAEGCASIADYIAALYDRAKRDEPARVGSPELAERMERLAEEGLASGAAVEATAAYWAALR